ncbi:MAG: hypothetical protein KA974_10085 [Saprospiraceae bacterium]|nr:hypothetical protein [Saprospiraceae bacterium]
MIPQFEGLSLAEMNVLLDATPYITVLVAGADGLIESEEQDWAVRLAEIRGFSNLSDEMNAYYDLVNERFDKRMLEIMDQFPTKVEDRNRLIALELSKLNDVLPKLEAKFAKKIYLSYLSFAEQIAKATGGFLRAGSISRAEKAVIGLDMINPI